MRTPSTETGSQAQRDRSERTWRHYSICEGASGLHVELGVLPPRLRDHILVTK